MRLVGLATSDSPDEPSQAANYQQLASQLEAAVHEALAKGSKRLLGTYLQSLLAYPDACTKGEQVIDPGSGAVIAAVPPLPEGHRYPKEQALLDLVEAEKRQGRRVLVYITHTATRDIASRLESVLIEAGHRVANIKAVTVPPERREDWVAQRVKAGLDVLLVHPRLVQTGLDYEESGRRASGPVSAARVRPGRGECAFVSAGRRYRPRPVANGRQSEPARR